MTCIYSIINKLNGNQYVGSAVNFYKRKQIHLKQLRLNIHHSRYLQRAWNKHKEDMFDFIVLEKVKSKDFLIQREQWWIDNSNSQYNVCKIAGSSLGVKRTAETIEKIRQANLGLKHPEWRNEIKSKAQGGVNHHGYGKKLSEETLKKKSESMKQYYKTHPHMRAKTVCKYDLEGTLLQCFDSVKLAAYDAEIHYLTLIRLINGKTKVRKLKQFQYKYEK